jgi:hypothetical protein
MYISKVKITLLCIVAAVAYGIIHDQITARLCVEYFTVAHPPLIHTISPTVLGLFWGTVATLGVGVILGVMLALVSQSEGVPPIPVPRVFRMLVGLLAITSIAAALAGVVGFELSRRSVVRLPATLVHLVPPDHHHRFMAVWFVHGASYLVGVTGGSLLIYRTWRERGRPRVLTVFPRTRAAVVRAVILIAIAALIIWFRFTAT